ncbi:MAG: hypothetical protein CMG21_00520 [Candidatus Marinimicrobia bacterium]|nr:hypothetical protein [Candidatus Neomarinimicrobiota bacterium]
MFISNKAKVFFLLILSFSLFFVLKLKNSNNSKINYIPSNTFLITSFNLSQVSDIDDYFDFLDSQKGNELLNNLKNKNIPKKIRDIIKNPSLIGLDHKKNIYICSSLHSEDNDDIYKNLSFNFIFPIKDLKLVSKNINQYVDFIPDKEIDIFDGEINGFKYFLFKNRFNEKRDLVMLSYNHDVVLLSIAPLDPLISLDFKKQLSTLENFNLIGEGKVSNLKKQQISLWVDLDKISINDSKFLIKSYTFIDWYFSDALLSINNIEDEIKFELSLFSNFSFYLKTIYPMLNLFNNKILYNLKSNFDFNSIANLKKISLKNKEKKEIELNHYIYLNKYVLKIKDNFYIDNQSLKSYFYTRLVDLVAFF